MRTVAVEYKIYKYNELSAEAKEKAKEWYLQGQEPFIFTENCKMDLDNLFGKNKLDVQYSLSCCQGDGFNIYGEIDAENIFNCLERHNGGKQLAKFEGTMTDKEQKAILAYAEVCGAIELPMNRQYCYSLADYIDIVEEWVWRLEYADYRDINVEALQKFEKLVRGIFHTLCKAYEDWGYKYFYEIDDEDMEELCDANEWEFMEDGTIF